MERLVGLFRVTSSVSAVVLLIAFNLVPLAGVLWWGRDVYSLLILYWVENGIVGALNLPKILRAEGPTTVSGVTFRVNGVVSRSRGAMVSFFLIHYGIFWLVHGVFVFLLPVFIGLGSLAEDATRGQVPSFEFAYPAVRWDGVAIGAVGLTISHTASYFLNFLARGEYRTISPVAQTMAPYARVIALHLAIVIGATLTGLAGSPIGALVVLVIAKTVIDLALHLLEHRRAGGRGITVAMG